MNENPITNQNLNPTPPSLTVPPATPTFPKIQIPQLVKDIFARFYSNKKIFWPVSGTIGLIILVLIVGLIFGKRTVNQVKLKPSPTPAQNQTSTQKTSTPDELSQIQIELGKIKDQIINLDVKQSSLQPPAVDYKISF